MGEAVVLASEGLTVGYRHGRAVRAVASDLSVTVRAGEMVALLGPNGAGKSTLIRTLCGLQPPLAGRVRLLGDDLLHLDPGERARRLSVVLTERLAVSQLTVEALVALGRQPHTDWAGRLGHHDWEVVDWALRAVHAADLAGRPVSELSDGERQKVLVARALAQEPAAVVLDEPTAFLDLPHRVELTRLLRRLARQTGKAVVFSTHDLDLALRIADRLWLLPPGGPLVSGAPEDLALDGQVGATFEQAGLSFNLDTGQFEAAAPHAGLVRLAGEGRRCEWTRRALDREGYEVAEAAAVGLEVTDQPPYWHATSGGQVTVLDNIAAVVRWLRATAPPPDLTARDEAGTTVG